MNNKVHLNSLEFEITQNLTHKQAKKDKATIETKFNYKDVECQGYS